MATTKTEKQFDASQDLTKSGFEYLDLEDQIYVPQVFPDTIGKCDVIRFLNLFVGRFVLNFLIIGICWVYAALYLLVKETKSRW